MQGDASLRANMTSLPYILAPEVLNIAIIAKSRNIDMLEILELGKLSFCQIRMLRGNR